MKIECDKCGAKYSIADDKVRGKTFKIRCKKCSNVIIVRDKAGGGDAAESEAPSDEPGWHLAIGGETVGPLTEQEVREKHAAGEIDRETSVWQEGFEDWLPLGDVGTFSDLADRAGAAPAAAAAPDPFAGGGDDDYSSSNRGGGGAAAFASTPEPAARAPAAAAVAVAASVTPAAASGGAAKAAAAADSPRVSALTSARNENSVLFSLDSLSSMAMGSKPAGGGGGASAPSSFSAGGGGGGGGGSHSPSASGNSEGSGLIDIRSMGAMLGGGGGGGGGGGDDDRDDSMLPSFGGTGFGGLAAAPLLTAAPPVASDAASAPEPQRQSQTPLYILIGILVLGLGGLAAYVVTRPAPLPQEKIVERIVAPPVQPDKNDDDDDKPKKKKDEEAEAEAEADAAGEAAGDEKNAAVPKPGDKKGTAKPGDKKGTPKPGDKKGETGDKPAVGTDPPAKVEPKKEDDATPSVECILDPSKCKKGGGGGATTKPPPDASMPEKLELADIKAGVSGPKSSAESNCKKHAKGGEKVKIKLSISGPAGTVLSSSAEDDAGNAALGSCVAAELKKATFKKVQKEQIGTVVSVSF